MIYARRVEYRGVFSIITSPEQYTEAKHDNVVRFNGDLRVDAITMMDFCISNVLSPTPYVKEHGIDASFNFDKVIHSVPQFKKEIGLCAYLTKEFDVVLFYCGHGYENTGNWYLDDSTYETSVSFTDVMGLWTDGIKNTCVKTLTIIMDSCYSGCWVKALREDTTLHDFPIAIVSAASDGVISNESAEAGAKKFTPYFLQGKPAIGKQSPMAYRTPSYNSALLGPLITKLCGRDKDST